MFTSPGNHHHYARRIIVLLFALGGVSTQAVAGVEETRACYGNSILVRLEHTGALLDIPTDLGADLFPPSGVTHNADDKVYSSWRATCHAEPVPVEGVYVYRRHLPTPILGLTGDAPTVRRFLLGPGSVSIYGTNKARVATALEAGDSVQVPGGLLRLEPQYEGKIGLYLASPDQLTPTGEPLAIDCAPGVFAEECRVSYGLGNGVKLTYWFMADQVAQEKWLELDRLMRRGAEKMIFKGVDE